MAGAVLIILFILVVLMSFKLISFAGVDLLNVTVPNIFFINYTLTAFAGTLLLYFGISPYYYLTLKIQNPSIILTLFLFSSLCMVLIAMGVYFCSRVLNLRAVPDLKPKASMTTLGKMVMYCTFGISVLVLVLYLKQLPTIPLFAYFSDSHGNIAQLRSAATNYFQGVGRYHYYSLFFMVLMPFISYVFISNALVTKKRTSRFIAVFVSVTTFSALILQTQKAPALLFMIGCFFVFLLTKQRRINIIVVVVIAMVSLIIIIPMYLIFMNMTGRSSMEIADSIMQRILIGQIAPAYFYLEMFPFHHDFLLGASFPNPRDVFPWEHFPVAVKVANYMKPHLLDKGIFGSAPTVFWAELYANFGYLAPLIMSPLIGIFLYLLHGLLSRLPDHPVKPALTVWCALHFMRIAGTGLSNFMLDTDLFAVVFLSGTVMFMDGKGKIKFRARSKPNHAFWVGD